MSSNLRRSATGADLTSGLTLPVGEEIYSLIQDLYPICRSITGEGFRKTLKILSNIVPLKTRDIPTGTRVFDWTIPKEWNIRDAYVKNSSGERVIDFRKHNLHVVNYSIPIRQKMSLRELRPHLHTILDYPDWIPYRTTYYKEDWGFCMSHRQLTEMQEDEYDVCIDSTLQEGYLTYGECYLPGQTTDEILVSAHACHPSLCNDNLSGVGVATFIAKHLSEISHRYSYRFLFIPGTIGSITWLSLNESRVSSIKHGLVLTCLGDPGHSTYKKSRRGNADIDRAMLHVLSSSGSPFEVQEFSPYGYDERQYCSPGFDLPVGCFMRTPHGKFPEYHSSADNLEFIGPDKLRDSFLKCLAVFYILESNRTYQSCNPKCEPQLGRYGLYRTIGGHRDEKVKETAILWVLNQSDGAHSLLDICERSGLRFGEIKEAADALLQFGLLSSC